MSIKYSIVCVHNYLNNKKDIFTVKKVTSTNVVPDQDSKYPSTFNIFEAKNMLNKLHNLQKGYTLANLYNYELRPIKEKE